MKNLINRILKEILLKVFNDRIIIFESSHHDSDPYLETMKENAKEYEKKIIQEEIYNLAAAMYKQNVVQVKKETDKVNKRTEFRVTVHCINFNK